jgi:hypothetical protein
MINLKKQLLIGLSCLVAIASTAQKKGDIQIKWGDNIPLTKKHYPVGFIGDEKNGFIQLTEKTNKEIGFTKISGKLDAQETKIEYLPKSKYLRFDDILELNGRSYVVFYDFSKSTMTQKLFAREIDMKSGGYAGEEILLLEEPATRSGRYNITIPDEGEHILVTKLLPRESKRDKINYDKYDYHLFNLQLKKVWSKEVKMPYVEADMNILNRRLVGENILIFFQKKSVSEDKRAEFDQLAVLQINGDLNEPKEHELDIKGTVFQEFIFGENKGENLLIAGYYKSSRKAFPFAGYFTGIFNTESYGLENVKTYSFSDEIIRGFESERTKRKLDKAIDKGKEIGIPYMEMRKIFNRKQGGWYVVGEQYHLVVTTTTDSKGNVRYTYHYYFQDVIVSAIDKNGEEEWTTKVPKNQHFINNTYGAGISAFEYNDNVYVFFIDNLKNKNLKSSESPIETRSIKDATFTCIKVAENGSINRISLFDTKDEAKVILPYAMDEMSPGIILSAARKASFGRKAVNTPALLYLN